MVAVGGGMQQIDLTHETALVKAALMYADHVTLASPKAMMLGKMGSFAPAEREARIDSIVRMMREREDTRGFAFEYEQLRAQRRLPPSKRLRLRHMQRLLNEAGEGFATAIDQAGAGSAELGRAISAGVVDVHGLGMDHDGAVDDDDWVFVVVRELEALMEDSLSRTARTFPMFDDGAGELLRSMVDEGKIVDPHLPRAAEVGIAGRLVGSLPAFPNAEMDVVLDVRDKLHAPLIRFRSALAQAGEQFDSAVWDEEFPREVDDLYRRDVAPALREVEEALDELDARPTLLRLTAGKEALAAASATIGVAAASGIASIDLPGLLYGAPAVGVISAATGEAARRRDIRRGAQRNAFYFLYESNRRLT
jgi:hypothetical protein